jgi:threonylcarbamoyladenosine tRNA methylthiotransferase MtaB
LRDLPGVEGVFGNREKERLGELIAHEPAETIAPGSAPRTRTRALVKIQDGCDNACTYCIIHVARGPQRSRPPDEVLEEVRARLAAGYQEIVLTGVHIGAYGHDGGRHEPALDLWRLVSRILAETDVPRLRLSSIEPWDLREHAFRLWEDERLCRHLHLPLQSGSDATLKRMARHYTIAEFTALVKSARVAIPGLAVTTDVIVGFPGESEGEFVESLTTVEALGFARVHVFPFSARPGTPAAQMRHSIPAQVKAERSRSMRAVAAESHRAFRQRFVGQTMQVLWESSRPGDDGALWSGLTDNYLRVYAPCADDLTNTLTPTRLRALAGGGIRGEIQAQKRGDGPQPIPICQK